MIQIFVDYDQIARDAASMLRLEAGLNPHDKALVELVGATGTPTADALKLLASWAASQDVLPSEQTGSSANR